MNGEMHFFVLDGFNELKMHHTNERRWQVKRRSCMS